MKHYTTTTLTKNGENIASATCSNSKFQSTQCYLLHLTYHLLTYCTNYPLFWKFWK